jgi:hypothetical protein
VKYITRLEREKEKEYILYSKGEEKKKVEKSGRYKVVILLSK